MEKSESITNLAKAILKFNENVGKIHKTSTNPFFKSKYASLPDILSGISEPLQEAGLVVTQLPDGMSLTTMLIHAESGEYICGSSEMKPVKNDPQSLGSAITYNRRYSLGAILNLNIDVDDDGNKATAPPKNQAVNSKVDIAFALVEIEKCETLEQLKSCWSQYSLLQSNAKFSTAKEEKKKIINT